MFISDVDLRNEEGRVDRNEEERYYEHFFLLFVFAFVEFTPFTACVSKTLEALLSRKHRLFRFEPHYISCVPVSQDRG